MTRAGSNQQIGNRITVSDGGPILTACAEASAAEGSPGRTAEGPGRDWWSGWGAAGGSGAKRVTTSEQKRRMGRPSSTNWTRSIAAALLRCSSSLPGRRELPKGNGLTWRRADDHRNLGILTRRAGLERSSLWPSTEV